MTDFREWVPGVTLGLENWKWVGLALLLCVAWITHKVAAFALGNGLAAIARRRAGLRRTADTIEKSKGAFGYFGSAGVLYLLYDHLELSEGWEFYVVLLIKGLASAGSLLLFYRLADVIGARLEDAAATSESKLDDQLAPMARKILKILFTLGAALFVLDNLGTDIWSLLAGLGVVGIGVGLAAKDTFANLFGSVTVLADRPFQVGDWVKIGDVEGTVEQIGFRSTHIRTFYNSRISVPNSKLVDTSIDNMGARSYRRYRTLLSVTYDTPPAKIEAFCRGIEMIVQANPDMRQDYYFVHLNDFGASSLDILVYVFFEVSDWGLELAAREHFILEILRLAETLGVSFAFPSSSVYLESTPDKPLPPHEITDPATLDTQARRFAKDGDLSQPRGDPHWHS